MNLIKELAEGGTLGLFSGIGQFARDMRAAITGEAVLTADQKAAVLQRVDELTASAQAFEFQASLGQIEINKIDASSGSNFRGGWRPALGWVCVAGLAYEFLVRVLLPWLVQVGAMATGSDATIPPMPPLDLKELMALIMALLGFGGFRMYEKIKGVG